METQFHSCLSRLSPIMHQFSWNWAKFFFVDFDTKVIKNSENFRFILYILLANCNLHHENECKKCLKRSLEQLFCQIYIFAYMIDLFLMGQTLTNVMLTKCKTDDVVRSKVWLKLYKRLKEIRLMVDG